MSLPAASEREQVPSELKAMADLDVAQLEAITPHVTTQLQIFNSQVVAHLKNYKPEIGRVHDRLGELAATDERLEAHLDALESDVVRNNDQAVSNHSSLAERLVKVEQLLSALPSWKEDLVGRIENLTRETRAKHEAAASRSTVLEDCLNSHIASTRERLDMLTSVARTAAEARAQQQERIDELDTELRRLRESTEKELTDIKIRLRRHDEQHVMESGKLAEHGGLLAGHKIELARLKDSSDQHNRQLENLARGLDKLHDIAAGLGQEVNLMKRGMASTDATLATLEAKVLSADAEAQMRLKSLDEGRTIMFQFRDETCANVDRIDKSAEILNDRVQMLDVKVETGPPGLWKMASQVAAHEDELASTRIGLAAFKSTNEELARRLEDVTSGLAHQREMGTQLREECRMLSDRLAKEAVHAQHYVDDCIEPCARKYELEALKKNVGSAMERLEAALAGSGERLKFQLLHDETAQVSTIREYMAEVERRNAAVTERVVQLEAGLAGEAERNRSVAGVTRDLRAAIDGMLCTSQADLARLRATMTSLHEEYAEMSKKARRAGLLTVSQVEDIIDMRLNGPMLDAILMKKLSSSTNMPAGGSGSSGLRALQGGPSFSNVALSFGRFTSGALRPGAGGPSWQPSSMQKQLAVGSPALSANVMSEASSGDVTGVGGVMGVNSYSGEMPVLNERPYSPLRPLSASMAPGGGSGVGPASSSDPALGLRLVTVESDMSRLFEAFKALGDKVAPVSEVMDLQQAVEDLTATVQQVKVGQGILGEAGEEAVRRHIHATLLPEMLQRQQQDTRRILGWMDEQLVDVSKELYIMRRNQERLQTRMAELNGGGGGVGGGAMLAEAAANDAAAAAATASRLSAAVTPIRSRPVPGRPMSASAALVSASSSAAFAALYGDGEAVALTARVEALSEQLYFLSDTLGLPLGRKSQPSHVRGAAASDSVSVGGEEEGRVGGDTAPAAPAGKSDDATYTEDIEKAPSTGDQDSQGNTSMLLVAASGDGGVSDSGGAAAAAARHTAAGANSGGGQGAPATELDGLNLSLPSLMQRILQLEASVHSIAAGQQALAAAAAVNATAQVVRSSSPMQQPRSSPTPPAVVSPPAATAAAVQGLVDAAVAELRLRLKLIEHEVPLMSRSFEVKALKRMLQDIMATAAAAASNAAAAASGNGGQPPLGLFDIGSRTGSSGALGLSLSSPGKQQQRANSSNRGGGNSGISPAVEVQLNKRLGSLEMAVTTMDERGRALESRWSNMEFKLGSATRDTQGELPRLQEAVSQLAKEVQRLTMAQNNSVGGGNENGGAGGNDGRGGSGGARGSGASRGPRAVGGGGGVSGGGGGGNVSFASVHAASMAEVVNVEISGIAHDLAVAAHEELQRTRNGPLPDGTQDGIPTPVAVANREAALARLRRKPLEVAAHVELLESVKLHLDRLMRRSTACTTDRLVLLAGMSAMKVKLLENEAEAFREQIIAVFRSLERAFTALVKLQEAVASKSSATAVGQLATMLQDVSAGLATLAAHAAIRDSTVGGPVTTRGPGSSGGGAAIAAITAASAAVEQARWRQGSAGSIDVVTAATSAAGGNLSLLTAPPGGPLEDALSLLASRMPSPTAVIRPASPVRLAGPGIHTAANRQHAAAARGGGGGGGGGATGASGGLRLTSTQGPPVVTVLNQSWPGPALANIASKPSAAISNGGISAVNLSGSGSSGPQLNGASTAGRGANGPLGGNHPSVAINIAGGSASGEAASIGIDGGGGANRVWSGRRPGSGVANGLHVGMAHPGGGSGSGGGGGGPQMRPPGLSQAVSGPMMTSGALPSIGGAGAGRNGGVRS